MTLQLSGMSALVTGGGRGVGSVLAERGASVCVSDLDEVGASETAAAIRDSGGTALAVNAWPAALNWGDQHDERRRTFVTVALATRAPFAFHMECDPIPEPRSVSRFGRVEITEGQLDNPYAEFRFESGRVMRSRCAANVMTNIACTPLGIPVLTLLLTHNVPDINIAIPDNVDVKGREWGVRASYGDNDEDYQGERCSLLHPATLRCCGYAD